MEATTCETCGGTGSVTETRSRWVGGTKTGYASTWTGAVRCDVCSGTGTDDWPAVWTDNRTEADLADEASYYAHLDRMAELDAIAEQAALTEEADPEGEIA